MKSKCELVRKGEVRRKGRAADKIVVDGKKTYSCYGFKDAMTDEPLPECQSCEIWERNW